MRIRVFKRSFTNVLIQSDIYVPITKKMENSKLTYVLLTILVLYIIFKIFMKITTGVYRGTERLEGKTFVVTGANSGIGRESVKDFARRGARVVMVCRDTEKGERVKKEIINSTGNNNISLLHVDFSKLSSVRACAKSILCNEPKIDVLLNNAGVLGVGFNKSDDGLDIQAQTNYFGPFLFTNLLLGRLKKSTPSRIVNVASVAHEYANLDLKHLDMSNVSLDVRNYCNTKLCNILFTNELAQKLRGTGVTVNSLHPGVVKTDILRKAPTLLRFLWNKIISLFYKSAVEGAQTNIFLCVSPEVENISGEYFADCKKKDTSNNAKCLGQAKKLWELSEKAVNLQPNEKFY